MDRMKKNGRQRSTEGWRNSGAGNRVKNKRIKEELIGREDTRNRAGLTRLTGSSTSFCTHIYRLLGASTIC